MFLSKRLNEDICFSETNYGENIMTQTSLLSNNERGTPSVKSGLSYIKRCTT